MTDRMKRAGHSAALAGIVLLVAAAAPAGEPATPPANAQPAAAAPADAGTPADAAATKARVAAEEKALRERADSYWKLRLAQSPETLKYYPHDEKGQIVGGFHAEGGTLQYTDYTIQRVVVDGDRGVVMVDVKTKLTGEQGARIPERFHEYLNQPVSEEWMRVEGTWYKKPVEAGLSRFMKQKHESIKREKAAAEAAEAAKAAEDAKAANAADAERASRSKPE
jgi:hypothetical protein